MKCLHELPLARNFAYGRTISTFLLESNIGALRRQAGVTQQRLANLSNVRRWCIAHSEAGLITLTEGEEKAVRAALLNLECMECGHVTQSGAEAREKILRELARPVQVKVIESRCGRFQFALAAARKGNAN